MPEVLYHYTWPGHLASIVAEKTIWPTESNISLEYPHYGPDVVWLLDGDQFPEGVKLPHGLLPVKMQARITVPVLRTAVRWMDWEWTEKMSPKWRETLIRTGGGEQAAEQWWVVPHPIISRHWLNLEWRDGSGAWRTGKMTA